jgi:hypothetical protein
MGLFDPMGLTRRMEFNAVDATGRVGSIPEPCSNKVDDRQLEMHRIPGPYNFR